MDNGTCYIPVFDFSCLSISNTGEIDKIPIEGVGRQITEAFKAIGFCYLKNHGLDQYLIDEYMDVSRQFFQKPEEEKRIYEMESGKIFGWLALEKEHFNPNVPSDFKEAFNFLPEKEPENFKNVAEFREINHKMFQNFTKLCIKVCDAMSIGMGLEKDFFANAHKGIGGKNNMTTLRALYYPPLLQETNLKAGQVRLGEHSDFGTITLLVQDDIGGLEVKIPGVGYIPAKPSPGTVLVNIGDMMQRWTNDQLSATKHRVLVPEDVTTKQKPRQSLAFFVDPENDCVIRCLDGSDKYEPVTCSEYLNFKFSETWY